MVGMDCYSLVLRTNLLGARQVNSTTAKLAGGASARTNRTDRRHCLNIWGLLAGATIVAPILGPTVYSLEQAVSGLETYTHATVC